MSWARQPIGAGARCSIRSTASVSFASLAVGSACARSKRSRRSPSLMSCVFADRPDVSIDGLERRHIGVETRDRILAAERESSVPATRAGWLARPELANSGGRHRARHGADRGRDRDRDARGERRQMPRQRGWTGCGWRRAGVLRARPGRTSSSLVTEGLAARGAWMLRSGRRSATAGRLRDRCRDGGWRDNLLGLWRHQVGRCDSCDVGRRRCARRSGRDVILSDGLAVGSGDSEFGWSLLRLAIESAPDWIFTNR